MDDGVITKETACYHPEPYWLISEAHWIKSPLLFLDDVAIPLPEYLRGREREADPVVPGPLLDRGLLKVLEPEWFVDEDATGKLTDIPISLIKSGDMRRRAVAGGDGDWSHKS